MRLDVSFQNKALYKGCETPGECPAEIIIRNVAAILSEEGARARRGTKGGCPYQDSTWSELTLVGSAPVWAFLVVFSAASSRFRHVYYDDGQAGPILVKDSGRKHTRPEFLAAAK